MDNANYVCKGLFLGNLKSASDGAFLSNKNITVVISICPDNPVRCSGVEYHSFPIDDSMRPSDDETMKFVQILGESVPLIRQSLIDGKRLLVHCGAGRQRSAAVVAAYMYTTNGGDLEDAICHVMTRRNVAFRVYEVDGCRKQVNWLKSLSHFCESAVKP